MTKLRDSNCAGFYHWPPLWIGNSEDEVNAAHAADPNMEVFAREMKCGVKTKVSIKGVFAFDFRNWPPGSLGPNKSWEVAVSERMRFMNLLLACFYSHLFRDSKSMGKMFVDRLSYCFAREFSVNPFIFGCDIRQSALNEMNETQHAACRKWHDIVPVGTICDALDQTDEALTNESTDAAVLGELLLHAFRLYDAGSYEASHIAAWTIAERCLNVIWKAHLDDSEDRYSGSTGDPQKKFINSERRQRLTGRDFTASIVSEVLSISGLLPFDELELAVEVRQTRNRWLHMLRSIEREDCAHAVNLARKLLRRSGILDIDVPFHVIGDVPLALLPDEDSGES